MKNFKFDIGIKTTENGAMVGFNLNEENPYFRNYTWINWNNEVNLDDLVYLLYDVLDYMQMFSAYDKEIIIIKKKHGRKYYCDDKKCEICKEEKE